MMIVRVAKVRGSQFARIARVRVRLDDAVCLYSAGSNSESVETVMATGKYLVLRHSGTQGDGDAGRVGCGRASGGYRYEVPKMEFRSH